MWVPAGLRGKIWLRALKLGSVAERDYNYFASLQREISSRSARHRRDGPHDAAAPSKEEDFFVFGEMVEEILLAFCRDPSVAQRSATPRPRPVVARNRSGQKCAFPPNGVPPFKGLSRLRLPVVLCVRTADRDLLLLS